MENVTAQDKFDQEVLDKSININVEEEEVFGKKVGFITRIFGCQHSRLSMPITTKEITYRFCPTCGIRRRYDLETSKLKGSYYYPAHTKELHHV